MIEQRTAERKLCFVKPHSKAYSLDSSAFLAADTFRPFLLFEPIFREALKYFLKHNPTGIVNC
ncbi:MAG TPA: hypothetical protein DD413_07420 [Ruminococcus sp.]|nr:hypothetical protein [Ruminococcus sp.]